LVEEKAVELDLHTDEVRAFVLVVLVEPVGERESRRVFFVVGTHGPEQCIMFG
jgi:hypothetical protein